MKKKLFAFLLVVMPLIIQAQNLNGRFTSSFYTFERFNSLNTSETFIRTNQALSFNANYDKFSLRTRLSFESNIGKSLDNDPRMRFYNLYLEARNLFDVATIKLGRQSLFTSVAGGLYDGINIKLQHSDFSLTGFYGGNVPAYQKLEFTDDLSNDYVLGGRLETTALKDFRFGVSYIDKNFKPVDYYALRMNEDLDPVTVLIQSKSNQFKYLSADAFYSYNTLGYINTRYEYDVNFEVTSKVEVEGRVNPTKDLGVNFYYNYREPRIRYNSIFSVFNYGNTHEIEGGIDYKLMNNYTFFVKYGDVTYNTENSSRITLGANTDYGSLSYRKTFGYAGELDAVSIYSARTFMDGFLTPSLGLSFTLYKLSKDDDANTIVALLAGCNVRPWKKFSFDLQGQYSHNKIYKNDFRVLFKVNHFFNTNF